MVLPAASWSTGRIASVAVADAEWVSKLQVSDHDDVQGETAKLTSLGALHVQQSMKSKLLKARKAPKVTAALKVCLDARIVEPSLRMEKASKDSVHLGLVHRRGASGNTRKARAQVPS